MKDVNIVFTFHICVSESVSVCARAHAYVSYVEYVLCFGFIYIVGSTS